MWVRDHEMYEETARKIRRGAVQRTEKERHTAGKKIDEQSKIKHRQTAWTDAANRRILGLTYYLLKTWLCKNLG